MYVPAFTPKYWTDRVTLWFLSFFVLGYSDSIMKQKSSKVKKKKKINFLNWLSQINSRPRCSFYQMCCSLITFPGLEERGRGAKRQSNKAADLILSKCHDDTRSSGGLRFNSPVSTQGGHVIFVHRRRIHFPAVLYYPLLYSKWKHVPGYIGGK